MRDEPIAETNTIFINVEGYAWIWYEFINQIICTQVTR